MKLFCLSLLAILVIMSSAYAAEEASDVLECPANCNNHGTCNGNTCSCNNGWGGDDCSIAIKDLPIGNQQSGSAPMWAWEYWRVSIPSGNRNTLLIQLDQESTEFGADCDLYIKHNSLPSHSNYDWRDVSLDGHLEQNITNPSGDYYIGVFAFLNCNYKIKASLGNACPNNCNGHGTCSALGKCQCSGGWTGVDCSEQIPSLTLNTPVDSSVRFREWKMFKVNLGQSYSLLSITLQQTGPNAATADLDLYVRRGLQPTIIDFDYANGTLSQTSVVNIADAAAGDWFIGVWAYACQSGQSCNFRISATIADRCPNRCSMRGFCRGTACSCSPGYTGSYCETQTAMMQIGQNYQGYVESFAWNYYQFRTLSNNPTRINVVAGAIHDGDCDIYVRKDSKPTIFQYDYKDNGVNTTTHLDISAPGSNSWWIGMYGYRRCDYTISISAITEGGNCRNGGVPSGATGTCICPAGWGGDICDIPVTPITASQSGTVGTVAQGAFVYYNFSLPETPTDLVIYLHETGENSRGNIWLFMSQQFVPTIRDHAFEDVDTNTQYHMLRITRNQLPQRRSGPQNFIIGVYGSPYLLAPSASYRLSVWAAPFH